MSIELLYRIQKSFQPGVKISLYYENETDQWWDRYDEIKRKWADRADYFFDCLSPEASQPYHKSYRMAGFIIERV